MQNVFEEKFKTLLQDTEVHLNKRTSLGPRATQQHSSSFVHLPQSQKYQHAVFKELDKLMLKFTQKSKCQETLEKESHEEGRPHQVAKHVRESLCHLHSVGLCVQSPVEQNRQSRNRPECKQKFRIYGKDH